MNILALDVATKTGWATKTASGSWNFKPQRDESSGMRLIRFRAKLIEIIKSEEINVVFFERTSGLYKASLISQSELHGVLKLVCLDLNVETHAFSATEIKAHATGKGNAGKPLMVKAAKEKLGYKGSDEDEVDALWILDLAKKLYDK